MDFEVALSQMFYLCVSPQKVYQHFKYHKVTKNQYARDDPAFLVLLSFFLCLSSVGCAIVFGLSFGSFIQLLLWIVFVDCIGTGIVIATLLWFIANRFMRQHVTHTVEQHVEWGYAFDVHCNAFFPLLMILHVLQLFLIKVVAHTWFISVVVGNTLWLLAISDYIYITFLGYRSLPFLRHTEFFLAPVLGVVLVYALALFFQWNFSLTVFHYYGLKSS